MKLDDPQKLREVLAQYLTHIRGLIEEESTAVAKLFVDGFLTVILPVEATGLTATINGADIDLAWTAGAEGDFEDVYRAEGTGALFPDDWTLVAADVAVLTAAATDTAPPPTDVGYVYTVVSKLAGLEALPSTFAGTL